MDKKRESIYMAKSPAKRPTKGFEEPLWDTANQLRSSIQRTKG